VIAGFCSFRVLDHQRRILHQSSLPYLSEDRDSTSYHHAMFILFVVEHPFCTNHVLLGAFHQRPDFIPSEVVQLILNGHHPVRITHSFFYLKRFQRENKQVMFIEICQSRMRCYPSLDAPDDVVHKMITLYALVHSWVRCLNLLLHWIIILFIVVLIKGFFTSISEFLEIYPESLEPTEFS
jgi:hypothetical protein